MKKLLPALTVLAGLSLSLMGCAGGPASDQGAGGDKTAAVESGDSPAAPADGLEAMTIGTPFRYVPLEIAEDDIAEVTINSWEYRLGEDFSPYGAKDPLPQEGLLVIDITWETVGGSTQSNTGYFETTDASGQNGYKLVTALDGKLKNGKVPAGEPRTGKVGWAIDRGVTTVYLTDYLWNRVASITIDTTK